MTYSQLKDRADAIARGALINITFGWAVAMVVGMIIAEHKIVAGMAMTMAAFVLLILLNLPSYLLDVFERLTDHFCPHIWANNKSAVVKKLARDKGLPVIDIKLSKMDPTDLKGIPE